MAATNTRLKENVWDYPRPSGLEKTPLHLRVVWTSADGEQLELASTNQGYRVLETSHPPTYYIPPADVDKTHLTKTSRSTFCKWKGVASYYTFTPPPSGTTPSPPVENRIWSYASPTAGTKFGPISGYLSFYASANTRDGEGSWKCFVEGEEVTPQEGDLYGGWITHEIEGKMKGGPGTWGW